MRQVIIYATLLVVLLCGAYLKWTAEPAPDSEDGVVLLAGEPDDITSVSWKSEDAEVLLTRKSDDHGDYLWVEHSKWEEQKIEGPTLPVDDASAGSGEEAEELAELPTEKVERRTVFKASDKGDALLAKLAPLQAIRKLDQVDADKLAEIGLDAPTESLVLTRGGDTVTLEIGGEAYGTKDRYVRHVGTGDIYLVDDQLVKDLEYSRTRLPDRSLWSLETPQIASVTIQHGDASRTLEQRNPDDPKAATWVPAGQEDEDEQVTTWLGKALRLKGTTYVDPAADDGPTDLQERFRMTLSPAAKDAQAETLVVLQDGEDGDWYGRSEHTRGLLKLLKAPTRAVADDVEGIVAD